MKTVLDAMPMTIILEFCHDTDYFKCGKRRVKRHVIWHTRWDNRFVFLAKHRLWAYLSDGGFICNG